MSNRITSNRTTSNPTTVLTSSELKSAIVRDPLIVTPETTVMSAIAQMSQLPLEARSSCVLVVLDGRLLGMLTERDVVRLSAQQRFLEDLAIEEVMTDPVVTLHEADFTDLFLAINLLQQHQIRYLPILNEQDHLVGLVTPESLELCKLVAGLEAKVMQLEAEKVQLLENRTAELEQQVTARTIALRAKAEREQLVTQIATQIRSSLSLQTILDTTVAQVRQLLGCDRVNIWQIEADWQTIVVAESTDSPLSLMGERINDTCFKQNRTEIYRQGQIRVVSDIDSTEMTDCHRDLLIRLQTRAKILVPLLCGDELWGLLKVTESQHPREWQPEEIELLETLAVQLAIALQQATTHQKLQEQLIERQQAEARLRESEQRYATLAAAAPVGIFRTDAEGNCTYVNDRWCQMAGLSPEQATGFGWVQGICQNDRESVSIAWYAAAQSNSSFALEYRFQRPDGVVTWVYGQAVAEHSVTGEAIGYVGTVTDISAQQAALRERKQAEAALIQSEAQSRAILAAIPDFLFRISADGRYREFVSSNREIDLLPGDFNSVGMAMVDVLPPEIAIRQLHYVEQALRTGELQIYEQQVQIGDRLQDEEVRVVKSGEDEVLLMVRDISARKRAEQQLYQLNQDLEAKVEERTAELQEREKFLQTVLDTFPLAVFWKDRNSAYLGCNRHFLRDTGLASVSEVIGKTDYDLPWGKTEAAAYQADDRQVMKADIAKLGIIETQVQLDGNQIWLETHKIPLHNRMGEIVGVLGTYQDISDRKQAEQTVRQQIEQEKLLREITQRIRQSLDLQTIFDTACQEIRQVIQADRVGIFKFYAESNFDDGEFVAESVIEGFPSVVAIRVHDHCFGENYAALYAKGRSYVVDDIYQHGISICHTDILAQFQVRANLVMPLLCGDQLWGLLCIHQCGTTRRWQQSEIDFNQQLANQLAIAIQQSNLFEQLQTELAERHRAEARLTETNAQLGISNQELARATRLKDEFLANMSHELRTPLNAILGMTEGLQETAFGTINEQQRRALQTIERSGSHLLELINDILDVAKIEAGQIILECSPVSVAHLCQSSLTFIKQQVFQKRIQLELKLPIQLPDLLVDERRIRQVLINLLNNAVKFTPEGGQICLEVSPSPASPAPEMAPEMAASPSPRLRIAVIDTGIGIAPENLKKLFQPFIQIDSALNRQYEGTGLGLALVKRLVELHGGSVGLTSAIGVGSCFTIDLPCTPVSTRHPEPISPATLGLTPSPAGETTAQPPLILLAEDNEANINTVSSYLGAKGYRILLAKNGQEAIDLAKAHQPHLILMDIQMPEIDGLEATRQIRLDPNLIEIPIIALTALAMTGDREKCLEAGATDYLTKPVRLKQLAATIQQFLDARDHRRDIPNE